MIGNMEDIDIELYDNMCSLTNALGIVEEAPKERHPRGQLISIRERMSALYQTKEVIDTTHFRLDGEVGSGGKPLKKNDNPYLEIDLIDPSDPIICEGEVQKYKPGFKPTFIDRWVQVTEKAFRYFVSKPGSNAPSLKPLLAVPLKAIRTVEKTEHLLQLGKKDVKNQAIAENQFEIFLKDDFLNYYLSSVYEKHFSPDGTRIN